MVTGRGQGERAGHRDVGQRGKCHTCSVLGGINPGGLDVDNNGTDTKY